MFRYAIRDDELGWITQDGKLVTSYDPQKLSDVFTFGTVTRLPLKLWLRPSVDLEAAWRKVEPRTVVTIPVEQKNRTGNPRDVVFSSGDHDPSQAIGATVRAILEHEQKRTKK